ncbi:MAG TPA: peptidoglycan DD-metalloendopeptidase family protein [Actinomycetota bacterium]|nr:peptidoglycan DD-metalloendopeptidase family protein [Actinomycetota bacterium]
MRMLPKRSDRGIAGLLLALLVVGLGIPASAEPGDLEDIRERQERIDARRDRKLAEAADVDDRVAELDRQRDTVEAKVAELASDVAELDGRIDKTKQKLAVAQQQLALLESKLDVIKGRLDRRTDLLTTRAVEAYKAGPVGYLDSLLSSTDIGELVDRVEYRESAMETDAELITSIERLQEKTEAREELAEEKKLEIAEAKLALEEDRAELAAKRDARASILAEKEELLSEKRAYLADLRSDAQRLAEVEAQLEADEARILAALAAVPAPSGPVPVGGGQLLFPAAGPITSPYGYRTHPIFGDQRLHTGIDIGAGYGAPVIAADSGTVAFAGVMSGYGNVIVIDHGGGLATTYNHLSAFYVGSGQIVSRGSSVGAVGCTGYCTGPHLHFEVRVNGSPVDPMPYLQ